MGISIRQHTAAGYEPHPTRFALARLLHCFVGFAIVSLGATFTYRSVPYLNALFILGFPASFVCLWTVTAGQFTDRTGWRCRAKTFSVSVAGVAAGIAIGLWLCG